MSILSDTLPFQFHPATREYSCVAENMISKRFQTTCVLIYVYFALFSNKNAVAYEKIDSEKFSKSLGQLLHYENSEMFDGANISTSIVHLRDEFLRGYTNRKELKSSAERSWQDDVGLWNVTTNTSHNKRTCILFQGAVQLDISYTQTDGKHYIARIDVPETADANGDCEDRSQFINLSWPVMLPNASISNGSLTIFFVNYYETKDLLEKASSPNRFAVSHIRISYPTATLPNADNPDEFLIVENKSLDNFSTPIDNSYKCELQELKSTHFSIRFADFQYQAFMKHRPESVQFHKPIFCHQEIEEEKKSVVKQLYIAFAVLLGFGGIFGFLYWHRQQRGDDDDEDDYDD